MAMNTARRTILSGASSLAMISVACAAHGQDAGSAGTAVVGLDEIVVTAQRRSEALQEVPIAVSAFSQDKLEAQRLDTGSQLVLAVPNVTFAQSYYSGFNFQIRGVGTQLGTASTDSGVGVHLNNVPLTSSRFFEAELFDVGQVEVLRGPQGTLYGRNATGGVVNVVTAAPEDDFSAMVNLEGANYGTFKAKGMVNVPVNDMLAVRLAGSYLRRSGFGENTFSGAEVNGRDLFSTRVSIAFHPSEALQANFMWQHFEEDDDRLRTGGVLCTPDPGPASVAGVTVSNPLTRGLLSQGCRNSSLYADAAHSGPNSVGTLFGLLPILFGVTNGDYNAGKRLSDDLNDTDSTFAPRYKAKDDIFQLNVVWNVTDTLQLSSLSAYAKDSLNHYGDFAGVVPTVGFNNTLLTPGGVFADPQLGRSDRSTSASWFQQTAEQWTQEFRLQSDFDGPFNFAIGANYLEYETDFKLTVLSNIFTLTAAATNGGAPCALGNPACIYIDPNPTSSEIGHNYYVNKTPYRLTSKAVFGEVYYNITDALKLTGGFRYTHDHKSQINYPVPLLSPGSGLKVGTPARFVSDFKEPTGRLGFDWKAQPGFTDSTLVYGFYSRGYKAGGSNPPAAVGIGSIKDNFEPEFVDSLEFGVKNTLLGGRLTANLTAFSYKYTDYQVSANVNRTQVVQNVDADVYGLEFEGAWQVTDRLQVDANVGLLHSELGDSASIDPINITAGNPALTLVKTADGNNCAVSTAALAPLLAIIEQRPGAPVVAGVSGNPFALLGVCSGGFSSLGINASEGQASRLSGNRLPNAPDWTVSIGAQYRWDLPGGWDATLRGDYYVQGASYARVYNTAVDRLKGWDNVNATLTLRREDGWEAQLFVKNLLDKQPIINTFLYDAITGLYTQGFTNEPRLMGASVTRKF
jgi:outer membrane receptor protein involved in Fe transport